MEGVGRIAERWSFEDIIIKHLELKYQRISWLILQGMTQVHLNSLPVFSKAVNQISFQTHDMHCTHSDAIVWKCHMPTVLIRKLEGEEHCTSHTYSKFKVFSIEIKLLRSCHLIPNSNEMRILFTLYWNREKEILFKGFWTIQTRAKYH